MFDAYCPECSKRLLIFPGQVRQIINDEAGITTLYTCWCGALGAMRTGVGADRHTEPIQPVHAHALAS